MAAVVLLLILLAVVVAWRLRSGRHHPPRVGGTPSRAPDDDPEFLRELDRRTRRDDDTV